MLVFHVDANSAYLSWTAVALLEQGYEVDLREIPSAIAGNPENRHGIILTKSIPAKRFGVATGESLYEAKQKGKARSVIYRTAELCEEKNMY